jgi:hypothetical protein
MSPGPTLQSTVKRKPSLLRTPLMAVTWMAQPHRKRGGKRFCAGLGYPRKPCKAMGRTSTWYLHRPGPRRFPLKSRWRPRKVADICDEYKGKFEMDRNIIGSELGTWTCTGQSLAVAASRTRGTTVGAQRRGYSQAACGPRACQDGLPAGCGTIRIIWDDC